MSNEAAERLLHLIRLHVPDANAGQMEVEAKAALATERKATVERIRAALNTDNTGISMLMGTENVSLLPVDGILAILDAEAAR